MNRILFRLFVLILMFVFPLMGKAQQVSTIYFMEDVPLRHLFNPAFQPTTDYYLSLPLIGYSQISLGNNSLTLKDVIYNYNGQTVSFLHPTGGNIPQFINALKPNTDIYGNFETNLISFGFKNKTSFWSFTLTEKISGNIDLPKDLIMLSILGTPQIDNNSFDFTRLQSSLSIYNEAALGYAKKINNKWSVGIKLKYLTGFGNFSYTNKTLKMLAGLDKWNINGEGSFNISSPYKMEIDNNFQSVNFSYPSSIANLLKPSGYGAGCDLGVTFKPLTNLTISASVIDLGFIHWRSNAQNINYKINYSFNGVGQIDSITGLNSFQPLINKFSNGNVLADSLIKVLQTSSTITKTFNSYSTSIPTKVNFGAEYKLEDYPLSVGLLSTTTFFNSTINEKITTSINVKPIKWLDTSLSYSLLEGQFSSIGAGIGLRTGIIYWFVAADYISFQKTTIALKKISSQYWDVNLAIPYNTKNCNFAFGISLVLDKVMPRYGLIKKKKKQDCNCNQKIIRVKYLKIKKSTKEMVLCKGFNTFVEQKNDFKF